ncbi:uncharacterized protein LOC121388110 [Gigantopelta aegis]|uniref:uncharacterized protein LOC121388110 n=1 Tax=Gigantopelta aegis TaxID=1735272 RepID=UPI001B88A026|nr:uncharacterized protein LOC121388110 [Gigantopelta aegis]
MKYVLRGHMTQELLSLARPSVTSDEIYFDGILGNVDTNTNVDDRLGTTAITVNALINTWTVYDSAKKTLSWITDTPPDVQRTVTAASRWLARHILGDQYKHDLVFFTVDSPAPDDSVYWYPTNRLEFLNGTSFSDDGDIPEEPFIGVVEGVIPEIQYQAMLKRKHFGLKTPEKFHGIKKSFYIYWSSDACSYAITLLALAQHNAIVNDH